jgi:hypothetical protein
VSTVIQFTRPKPPRPSATGSSNPTRKKEPRRPGDEAEPPGSSTERELLGADQASHRTAAAAL